MGFLPDVPVEDSQPMFFILFPEPFQVTRHGQSVYIELLVIIHILIDSIKNR